MHIRSTITKRTVKQRNRQGEIFTYDRYMLNYVDPHSGKRVVKRYNRRLDAEEAQIELIKNVDTLVRRKPGKGLTLGEAVENWLRSKEKVVGKSTLRGYTQIVNDYILGPVYPGAPVDKWRASVTGEKPDGVKPVNMFGRARVIEEINTAEIRAWYHKVLEVSTPYVAKISKKFLSSIFRLVEEDYEVRLARIPHRPGPSYQRKTRQLLDESQVQKLLITAQEDQKWGAYYAFLILTGVRPSEMLGLLWSEVDLERGRVRIIRTQNDDGSLKEFPKTKAGIREIPLNSILRDILIRWQPLCPRRDGKLYRVFPAQGRPGGRGRSAKKSDGALSIHNFRMRVWYPVLKRLELPKITIYATRHMAISYLQSQGVELGMVAKIAGHASPQITLQYYTHAVRDAGDVMECLNDAYGVSNRTSPVETQVQPYRRHAPYVFKRY